MIIRFKVQCIDIIRRKCSNFRILNKEMATITRKTKTLPFLRKKKKKFNIFHVFCLFFTCFIIHRRRYCRRHRHHRSIVIIFRCKQNCMVCITKKREREEPEHGVSFVIDKIALLTFISTLTTMTFSWASFILIFCCGLLFFLFFQWT